MTITDYIIIFISVFLYVATFIYQGRKIKLLEVVLKNQNDFVNSYENYKKLLNDTLDLRLQNQKEELEAAFRKQGREITQETLQSAIKTFQRESEKMMKGWEELCQIAISIALKTFPTKAYKKERDEHIRKNYPNNAEYFISFIDDFLDGKINFDKP